MAYQRLGRKLEDAIAAYLTGEKGTLLSGVQIATAKQEAVLNPPFVTIFSGSESPWSDSDRRGDLRGPKRVIMRITIGEHMTGSSMDQFCGEFEELISRPTRLGVIQGAVANDSTFILDYGAIGSVYDAGNPPEAGDILQFNSTEYEVVASVDGGGVEWIITVDTPFTASANAPVFMDTVTKRPDEYGDIIRQMTLTGAPYKPATGLTILGLRFITAAPSAAEDMRLHEYEFEIDALNCDDLT